MKDKKQEQRDKTKDETKGKKKNTKGEKKNTKGETHHKPQNRLTSHVQDKPIKQAKHATNTNPQTPLKPLKTRNRAIFASDPTRAKQ